MSLLNSLFRKPITFNTVKNFPFFFFDHYPINKLSAKAMTITGKQLNMIETLLE